MVPKLNFKQRLGSSGKQIGGVIKLQIQEEEDCAYQSVAFLSLKRFFLFIF